MQQNSFKAQGRAPGPGEPTPSTTHLAEIWGDVVDLRHLSAAVIIAALISVGTFLIASNLFASVVAAKDIGRAYAMLAGLVGCVISAIVCAKLFAPKREIVDVGADEQWRTATIDDLIKETGSTGATADLPPAVIDELKELGLYAAFASHDTPHSTTEEA